MNEIPLTHILFVSTALFFYRDVWLVSPGGNMITMLMVGGADPEQCEHQFYCL